MLKAIAAGLSIIFFTMVTAYVFKFGRSRSGIYPDYVVYGLITILMLKLGGVI